MVMENVLRGGGKQYTLNVRSRGKHSSRETSGLEGKTKLTGFPRDLTLNVFKSHNNALGHCIRKDFFSCDLICNF